MIKILIYTTAIYLTVSALLFTVYFIFIPKATRTVSPGWAAVICLLWLFILPSWIKAERRIQHTGKHNRREFERFVKDKLPLLLVVLVLSSCTPTLYQSQKQLNKVQHYHPELVAAICAKEFPVKFDTVKGPAVIIRRVDTVLGPMVRVNCDSLISSLPGPAVITVKCPPSITMIDSVYIPEIITVENTAKATELQLKLDNKEADAAKSKGSLSTWRGVAFTFIGLFVLACVGVGVALKRKIV